MKKDFFISSNPMLGVVAPSELAMKYETFFIKTFAG